MTNPTGDSTITGLPGAAVLTGNEFLAIDQKQNDGTIKTVKITLAIIGTSPIWLSGTTAQRNALSAVTFQVGQPWFDTTLGFVVNLKSTGPNVWVNAAGVVE